MERVVRVRRRCEYERGMEMKAGWWEGKRDGGESEEGRGMESVIREHKGGGGEKAEVKRERRKYAGFKREWKKEKEVRWERQ